MSSNIGVGDLAARLVHHLVKTKKETNRGRAVIKAMEYYRFQRGKDHKFDPMIFGDIFQASKKSIPRGRPRGAKKIVVEEVETVPVEVVPTEAELDALLEQANPATVVSMM